MNENGKEGGFKFIILVLTWIPDDKAAKQVNDFKGWFWYETWILYIADKYLMHKKFLAWKTVFQLVSCGIYRSVVPEFVGVVAEYFNLSLRLHIIGLWSLFLATWWIDRSWLCHGVSCFLGNNPCSLKICCNTRTQLGLYDWYFLVLQGTSSSKWCTLLTFCATYEYLLYMYPCFPWESIATHRMS